MTWEWSRYLDLARELRRQAADPNTPPDLVEALLRAAASRAYYAAFNAAREWAETRGYVPHSRASAHQSLIDHLTAQGAKPDEKRVGDGLRRARFCREKADYEADLSPPRTWENEADNAIRYAEDIFKRL